MSGLPESLAAAAWNVDHAAPPAPIGAGTGGWAVRRHHEPFVRLAAAEEPADLRDWADPRVGWGVIVADDDAVPAADRAVGADLPEPLRRLIAARGAPLFRYRDEHRHRFLSRYTEDGSTLPPLSVTDSARGVAAGHLPRYLLIYGSPRRVPWRFQYVLNNVAFAGRLWFEGEDADQQLRHYVNALIAGWGDSGNPARRRVVWSVDHGGSDITRLMRHAIAEPVHAQLAADAEIGQEAVKIAGGGAATVAALSETLAERRPPLVVTTSHGMTGPLDDPARMGERLGLPVDDDGAVLDVDVLLGDWQPDGAVWYAHACCSAGADDTTSYAGLFREGSELAEVLEGITAVGARLAPLPARLLGAPKPARAFIGQVEPTFDWTLRQETGQLMTISLVNALYQGMHRARPEPVGMALARFYSQVGVLLSQWNEARRDAASLVAGAEVDALRCQLAALDRQSLVVLGDPAVALPPLG